MHQISSIKSHSFSPYPQDGSSTASCTHNSQWEKKDTAQDGRFTYHTLRELRLLPSLFRPLFPLLNNGLEWIKMVRETDASTTTLVNIFWYFFVLFLFYCFVCLILIPTKDIEKNLHVNFPRPHVLCAPIFLFPSMSFYKVPTNKSNRNKAKQNLFGRTWT